MSKKTAWLICCLFDLFAFYGFWQGYDVINQVMSAIDQSTKVISFSNRTGFHFLGVVMPVAQILAIIEAFWPQWVKKNIAVINKSVLIGGIALFAGAIFFSIYLRKHVERAGYQYCPKATHTRLFSTDLVYTSDDAICRELVEKEKAGIRDKY